MKNTASLLSLVLVAAFAWVAKADTNPFKDPLSHAKAAELPLKATELAKAAKVTDRQNVTINVVRAATQLNPAAAPAVVAAIARALPEVAAVAAATAAAEQPKLA